MLFVTKNVTSGYVTQIWNEWDWIGLNVSVAMWKVVDIPTTSQTDNICALWLLNNLNGLLCHPESARAPHLLG